jgi:hypothetical protein
MSVRRCRREVNLFAKINRREQNVLQMGLKRHDDGRVSQKGGQRPDPRNAGACAEARIGMIASVVIVVRRGGLAAVRC